MIVIRKMHVLLQPGASILILILIYDLTGNHISHAHECIFTMSEEYVITWS